MQCKYSVTYEAKIIKKQSAHNANCSAKILNL
nr:MAG TPA: hypothetical protein [Caudoviricetes sp.]